MQRLPVAVVLATVVSGVVALPRTHASATGHLRLGQLNGQALPGTEDEPANSDSIDGPDCGRAKQIVGKLAHAGNIGEAAGAAKAAVLSADHAVSVTDAAAARARELGSSFGKDGVPPEHVEVVAKASVDAGMAVRSAKQALDSELSTFKGKMTEGNFPGSAVSGEAIANLRKLTASVGAKTKDAHEAAARAIDVTEAARADAMQSTQVVARMIGDVLDKAGPVENDAADVQQKATWATKVAEEKLNEARKLTEPLSQAITNASSQAPVWQALKESLDSHVTAVDEAKQSVTREIITLGQAAGALGEKTTSLKAAAERGVAGESQAVLAEADSVRVVERALSEAQQAIATVKAKVEAMAARQERLEAAANEAAAKLAAHSA